MAVNRERAQVERHKTDLDLEYDTLGQALATIHRLITTHGADARLKKYQASYSDSEYLGVYVLEPETDKEMARRIAQEEKWETEQAERDRRDYERLKVKLGV